MFKNASYLNIYQAKDIRSNCTGFGDIPWFLFHILHVQYYNTVYVDTLQHDKRNHTFFRHIWISQLLLCYTKYHKSLLNNSRAFNTTLLGMSVHVRFYLSQGGEAMHRTTRPWQYPPTRLLALTGLLAMLLGLGGLPIFHTSSTAHAATSSCQLNSPAGNIQHVISIQFDNTHFTRDNPNVPSDLELSKP
jgi:hypothetical protein